MLGLRTLWLKLRTYWRQSTPSDEPDPHTLCVSKITTPHVTADDPGLELPYGMEWDDPGIERRG